MFCSEDTDQCTDSLCELPKYKEATVMTFSDELKLGSRARIIAREGYIVTDVSLNGVSVPLKMILFINRAITHLSRPRGPNAAT